MIIDIPLSQETEFTSPPAATPPPKAGRKLITANPYLPWGRDGKKQAQQLGRPQRRKLVGSINHHDLEGTRVNYVA